MFDTWAHGHLKIYPIKDIQNKVFLLQILYSGKKRLLINMMHILLLILLLLYFLFFRLKKEIRKSPCMGFFFVLGLVFYVCM